MDKMNMGVASLNILYSTPTSFNIPLTNGKVKQFQSNALSKSNTMNALSDKGRKRMLSMFGQQSNANVEGLINSSSRTGGVQVIN